MVNATLILAPLLPSTRYDSCCEDHQALGKTNIIDHYYFSLRKIPTYISVNEQKVCLLTFRGNFSSLKSREVHVFQLVSPPEIDWFSKTQCQSIKESSIIIVDIFTGSYPLLIFTFSSVVLSSFFLINYQSIKLEDYVRGV